jgi:predicted Rossmann fold nucleotide-binding protein DprA/Smf involved in DNA uptake
MTNREFYENVLNLIAVLTEDKPHDAVDTAEMSAKATELIEKLDATNAKRASADSKQKKEVSARREVVFAALSAEPMTADAIAEKCGVTVGQARAALTAFVKDERAVKAEVKIGKTRKMVYSLPVAE